MHHDEMWQVYAPNGEAVPGEGWDSALDNPEKTGSDKIVGVAVVFLYRYNASGELELLWQKRAHGIDRYPGYYDISAGGHINLGETVVEGAIREAREEIGAVITESDLQFAFTKPFNRNRFAWIFMVDWTGRAEEFCFNDNEVSEVKWVKYVETEEFRKKYAKPPLQKDDITFVNLDDWMRMRGMVDGNGLGNYAFIDGNNLYLGAKNQGISIDYRKLRLYLKNKLNVGKAFLFIGYDKSRMKMYGMMEKCGFELIFKPAVFYTGKDGKRTMKGNVDAEIVLHSAAVEYDNYDKAVIVTGDGDFACLMDYLKRNGKLKKIITPTANFSLLLKPYIKDIVPIEVIKERIQKQEK